MIYIDCPKCTKSTLVHHVENIYHGQRVICTGCRRVIEIHLSLENIPGSVQEGITTWEKEQLGPAITLEKK